MIGITISTFMGMEEYFGGKKSQRVEVSENTTVGCMLQELASMFGEDFSENVLVNSLELKRGIVLMVNGVNILARKGYDTELREGDRVLFFPPVGGG